MRKIIICDAFGIGFHNNPRRTNNKATPESLEKWGQQVLHDIWNELENELKLPVIQTDEEQWLLNTFLEHQCRNFVGRGDLLNKLSAWTINPSINDNDWARCITGIAGTGKSAFLSNLYKKLKSDKSEPIVLFHTAGISVRSGQIDYFLGSWIKQLAAFLNEKDALTDPAKPEEIYQTFRILLNRVSKEKRVILLLDALGQFEATSHANDLIWLPETWPNNVCFIATAIPCPASERLQEKLGNKSSHILLESLAEDEARQIAKGIFQRYRRVLDQKVLEELLGKQDSEGNMAAGIPLWLTLAVERLNSIDADDFSLTETNFQGTPEERLLQLLLKIVSDMPSEVDALYNFLLDKAERIFPETAQIFIRLIALSRNGWREQDFQNLIPELSNQPWNALKFAMLRRIFRGHIVQRGSHGEWTFTHAQLRRAVNIDERDAKKLHLDIANYLRKLPQDDPLHISETMVHLIRSGDNDNAAKYYAQELNKHERHGANEALISYILEKEKNIGWIISFLEKTLQFDEKYQICSSFNKIIYPAIANKTTINIRLNFLEKILESLQYLLSHQYDNNDFQEDRAIVYNRLGSIYLLKNEFEEAIEMYRKSLDIYSELKQRDPNNIKWRWEAGVVYHRIGDVYREKGDFNKALNVYDLKEGLLKEFLLSSPVKNYINSLENLKKIEQEQSDPEFLEILASSYSRLGDVHKTQIQLQEREYQGIVCDEAFNAYNNALEVYQRLSELEPYRLSTKYSIAISYINLGEISEIKGNLRGSLLNYYNSLSILKILVKQDLDSMIWQSRLAAIHEKIGDIYKKKYDFESALKHYQDALVIRQLLSNRNTNDLSYRHELANNLSKISILKSHTVDLKYALDYLNDTLSIREFLAKKDPYNLDWQRDLANDYIRMGEFFQNQGELELASKKYQDACSIYEKLYRKEELADCYKKICNVLQIQNKPFLAFEFYQKQLLTYQRLDTQMDHVYEQGIEIINEIINYPQGTEKQDFEIILKIIESLPANAKYINKCCDYIKKLSICNFDIDLVKKVIEIFERKRIRFIELIYQNLGTKMDYAYEQGIELINEIINYPQDNEKQGISACNFDIDLVKKIIKIGEIKRIRFVEFYSKSLEFCESLLEEELEEEAENLDYLKELANIYYRIANLIQQKNRSEAAKLFEKARNIRQHLKNTS